jgi:hypothetical protein
MGEGKKGGGGWVGPRGNPTLDGGERHNNQTFVSPLVRKRHGKRSEENWSEMFTFVCLFVCLFIRGEAIVAYARHRS